MGVIQACPFPERIARPTLEQANKCDLRGNKPYVKYDLPPGWSIVDESLTPYDTLPEFYIVDDNNMVRLYINGIWDLYIHHLSLTVDEPYL